MPLQYVVEDNTSSYGQTISSRNAQIPGARLPKQLNFIPQWLTFERHKCGICLTSPFWHTEF